jgi:L-ascorbate metabolism protein UlaG (beta-lactamase superfamily)
LKAETSDGTSPILTLTVLRERLSICRLRAGAEVPAWATGTSFFSVTRTEDELSIVCPEEDVPGGVSQERGWRALKLEGPFSLSMVGILSSLAAPLAEAGASIFAISTFDTDYVLVREGQLDLAVDTLRENGHLVGDYSAGEETMRIRFLRHATFVFEAGGQRVLVDPMLAPAGATDPVANTPNQRRNPLVELPVDEAGTLGLLEEADAVLVTHTHNDHWDGRARDLIPKHTPIFCQPEDWEIISAAGFKRVTPVEDGLEWRGLSFTRTGGRHGTGEIGNLMAPVSGFVVGAEDSPTLYIAGDTIWCPEVEDALDVHIPDVVVVNAGAARFLEGDPITMTADDVARVCRALPEARVVAVHMEAINHCLLTRGELEGKLQNEQLSERVEIPADGETLEVP